MKSSYSRLALVVGFVSMGLSIALSQTRPHAYVFSTNDRQAWLGVQVQDVTKELKERKDLSVAKGAYVSEVTDESPAEKAEIRKGDVLVKFDGKEIEDSDDLIKAVRKGKPHTDVKLEVVRKAEHLTLTATLGREPRSYAFNFRMPRMPSMPRMAPLPRGGVHLFSPERDLDGLEVQSLTKQLAEYFDVPDRRGVLVTSVESSSGAGKAGFKAGDVIVKLDGSTVRDVDDLSEAIDDVRKADEVPCEIIRKGKPLTLKWHIDRSDNSDWDDDDDTSLNGIAPEALSRIDCEQAHHSFFHSPKLDQLRENLNRLHRQLQERFHDLKEKIRERFSSVWEEFTSSFG